MIKIIAAVSQNGVIGKNNDLPWASKYKEDMQFFRKMTANSTVIMGRATFESMGSRLLPKRRNIVISRNKIETDGVETFDNLSHAITSAGMNELDDDSLPPPPVWLIGGFSIYHEGMKYADEIYLTLIPEVITGDNLISFPWIDPSKFKVSDFISLENSDLKVAKYVRI